MCQHHTGRTLLAKENPPVARQVVESFFRNFSDALDPVREDVVEEPDGSSFTHYPHRGEIAFLTRDGWPHEFIVRRSVNEVTVPAGVTGVSPGRFELVGAAIALAFGSKGVDRFTGDGVMAEMGRVPWDAVSSVSVGVVGGLLVRPLV